MIGPDFPQVLLENLPLLEHVRRCAECQEELYSYAEYLTCAATGFPSLSESEKAKVWLVVNNQAANSSVHGMSFAWRNIKNLLGCSREILAAADGQNPDQQLQESSLTSGYFCFKARCDRNNPHYWVVRIAIPPRPDQDTMLRIHFEDGQGKRILAGIFHLCGIPLRVKDGKSFLKLSDFQKHLDIPMAVFEHPDGTTQEGNPVLFDDELE